MTPELRPQGEPEPAVTQGEVRAPAEPPHRQGTWKAGGRDVRPRDWAERVQEKLWVKAQVPDLRVWEQLTDTEPCSRGPGLMYLKMDVEVGDTHPDSVREQGKGAVALWPVRTKGRTPDW